MHVFGALAALLTAVLALVTPQTPGADIDNLNQVY